MSQTTQMTHIRPAVLAITGIAAIYGAYIIYTAYSKEPEATKPPNRNSGLRRRGAVHRTRAERLDVTVEIWKPDNQDPLGRLRIRAGSASIVYAVTLDASQPTPADVERDVGVPINIANLKALLGPATIHCILEAVFLTWDQDNRDSFPVPELAPLGEILATRDLTIILQQAPHVLQEVLYGTPNRSDIDTAFHSFLHGSVFTSAGRRDNSEHATHAETEDASGLDGMSDIPEEPSQGLKGLLYHIAQAEANRKAYEHRGIHCDECGESPIRGIRWHCMNCPDWDLCSNCEANTGHPQHHVFVKIRVPFLVLSRLPRSQPSWYTGDPKETHHDLDPGLIKSFGDKYALEGPRIDALFEQFCCLANVRNSDDRTSLEFGIDRAGFDKACYPGDTFKSRWRPLFTPNDVYDRVFAFYDRDHNGVIDFEEFISGMSYLRGPNRYKPLTRALEGFDIDRDGFVDRYDFIRLFRAKHNVQRLLVESMIEAQETQYTQEGMERLRSSQPISSIFAEEEIPPGESRARTSKTLDRYGDMQPDPGIKTILNDNEGWPDARQRRQARDEARRPAHERLQIQLSNVDDIVERSLGNGSPSRIQDSSSAAGAAVTTPQMPSAEPSRTSSIESDVDDGELDQDMIWEIVEEGFHEMLNPLFDKRERADNDVVSTRADRERWQKQIHEVVAESKRRETMKRELQNGARTDPLMATAMNAYDRPPLPAHVESNGAIDLRAGMVPTDPETLMKREEEILQRPLEELLNVSGYGVVDGDPISDPVASENRWISEGRSVEQMSLSADEPEPDPTMPQHRPNGPNSSHTLEVDESADAQVEGKGDSATNKATKEPSTPPSQDYLELLVHHNELDEEIRTRGGIGRLSYDEVEELVRADHRKELRGLVTSWLEWASF